MANEKLIEGIKSEKNRAINAKMNLNKEKI